MTVNLPYWISPQSRSGTSNPEIAEGLHVAVATVKGYWSTFSKSPMLHVLSKYALVGA